LCDIRIKFHADQHPIDILDSVHNAARGRPVHCIYLSAEEQIDKIAVELLEDLAVELYGSFHIITLTQHGVFSILSIIASLAFR
jgi:hypothetical protein